MFYTCSEFRHAAVVQVLSQRVKHGLICRQSADAQPPQCLYFLVTTIYFSKQWLSAALNTWNGCQLAYLMCTVLALLSKRGVYHAEALCIDFGDRKCQTLMAILDKLNLIFNSK